nr:uncharacterized protein LOC129254382 [Lytechinus pictus]
MINLTVNYHRPSSTVDSQTVDGAYLVHDQVVPNGVNGIAKRHVVVFRQRRFKKNKYMVMAAIFFVVVVLLIVGLIAGVYHPGFETDSDSSSLSSSSPVSTPDHSSHVPPSTTLPNQLNCGTRPGFTTRHRRVVHGRASEIGQWPWQVFIRENDGYVCGGVIVDPQWVFTAAHCVTLFDKSRRAQAADITVVAGSIHRETYDEGTQERSVIRFIVHPGYSKESVLFNYDMILLKLDRPFEITDHVRTICLESLINSDLYDPGKKCIVAGWGFTARREFPFDENTELVYAEIPLIKPKECFEWASRISRKQELQITPQRLCAGYEDNRQLLAHISVPCRGDSGSPLVCEDTLSESWHLIGLVSSGPKCGEVSYFTNVSAVSDFWHIIYNETALPPIDFDCKNGNGSIPLEWMCDGFVDCLDMSDETECECTERQFQCDNGRCILDQLRCDSIDTCGDGSDERDCSYFNCSDGQLVSETAVCDGFYDCSNMRDESNDICHYNPETHYACPEGIRIQHSWLCDGRKDCENGEDEDGCDCASHQFACDNRCIHGHYVCDEVFDCDDGKDEQNCTCSEDKFFCGAAGLCWDNKMKQYCDQRRNCVQDTLMPGITCDIFDFCASEDQLSTCQSLLDNVRNKTQVGNGG